MRLPSRGGGALRLDVSLVEQLALYQVFHRDPRNRTAHYVALPLILLSGFVIVASLSPPVTLLALAAAVACYATLDVLTAVAFAAWVVPLWCAAEVVARRFGVGPSLVAGFLVQGASWFLSVSVGHERFEPWVDVGSRRVSSNVYFARRMFWLRNVGRPVSLLAAVSQFAIGPLHMTMQAMFLLGYRPGLRTEIESLVVENLARLARDEPLLAMRDEYPVHVTS